MLAYAWRSFYRCISSYIKEMGAEGEARLENVPRLLQGPRLEASSYAELGRRWNGVARLTGLILLSGSLPGDPYSVRYLGGPEERALVLNTNSCFANTFRWLELDCRSKYHSHNQD